MHPQTTSIIKVNRTFLLCNVYSSTVHSTVKWSDFEEKKYIILSMLCQIVVGPQFQTLMAYAFGRPQKILLKMKINEFILFLVAFFCFLIFIKEKRNFYIYPS